MGAESESAESCSQTGTRGMLRAEYMYDLTIKSIAKKIYQLRGKVLVDEFFSLQCRSPTHVRIPDYGPV